MKRSKAIDALHSIGVIFENGDNTLFSPEEVIILVAQNSDFPKDRKLISLMLAWLNKYRKYVYVERLKNMIKGLDVRTIAVIGAISLKQQNGGDHRWKAINKQIDKVIGNSKITFDEICDHSFFLKKHGIDSEFSSYGMKVGEVQAEDERKILSDKFVFKNNTWIKNRCLFGANLRADIATILELKLATTAYQASKIVVCTPRAAYSNWDELIKVGCWV